MAAVFAITLSAQAQRSATPSEQIHLPDDFKIELLYSVPRDDQGSWVAMCQDDKGRLIVSDQHGGLYRFPIPKLGEPVDPASIQPITYSIVVAKERRMMKGTDPKPLTEELAKLPKTGHAQGICYAFDSLYVVVSSRNSAMGCGVIRLLDTDGDDNFDKLVKLKSLGDTAGEHGPHAIVPAPNGKHLYVVIGNQTKVPADYTHSLVPAVWGEDQLLPPLQRYPYHPGFLLHPTLCARVFHASFLCVCCDCGLTGSRSPCQYPHWFRVTEVPCRHSSISPLASRRRS